MSHIRRSKPVVHIAGLGSDELSHECKSDDIVFDLFLNFLMRATSSSLGLDRRDRIEGMTPSQQTSQAAISTATTAIPVFLVQMAPSEDDVTEIKHYPFKASKTKIEMENR